MKKAIGLVMLILVSVSACNLRNNSDDLTLDYALTHANQRREIINQPTIECLVNIVSSRAIPPTIIDLRELMTERPSARSISSEDAIYDTIILFNFMRNFYGAYYYFGGDDMFLPLMDGIIAELQSQGLWTGLNFSLLLVNNLSSIIADNHFWFGGRALGVTATFFVSDSSFTRSDYGLRHTESGLYVKGIVGYEMDQVFRLALNQTGEFLYTIVVPSVDNTLLQDSSYEITILFDNGSEMIKALYPSHSRSRPFEEPSLRFDGDVPIVTIMQMFHSDAPEQFFAEQNMQANRFLSFADELIYEPILVIDIRSNRGGAQHLGTQWLYRLLGETIPPNFTMIRQDMETLLSEEMTYIVAPDAPERASTIYNPYERLLDLPFFFSPAIHARNIESDQLIILLVDRHTTSAGEIFTSQLFNIKNTLVVGQNTSGTLITTGSGAPFYLPNSGIEFWFGGGQNVYPPGHFAEGIGLAPDVWVNGDALTAVLAMLERNR